MSAGTIASSTPLRPSSTVARASAIDSPRSCSTQLSRASPKQRLVVAEPALRPLAARALGERDVTGGAPRVGPSRSPARERHRDRQLGPLDQRLVGQRGAPAQQRRDLARAQQLQVLAAQHRGERRLLAGLGGVVERVLGQPVLVAPAPRRARGSAPPRPGRPRRARAGAARRRDGGSGTTRRARRARSGSGWCARGRAAAAAESVRASTASQSAALKRPSVDVSSMNRRVSASSVSSTSPDR